MSQHPCSNLCFQAPVSQRCIFFLKLDPLSPLQLITFRVLVHPRLWLRTCSFWNVTALIRDGPCPLGCSKAGLYGLGCLRGQQVRVRRVRAQTSCQNRSLNRPYIELLEQSLGAALLPKAAVSHSSSFINVLLSPGQTHESDLIIIPRYLMSNEKDIC